MAARAAGGCGDARDTRAPLLDELMPWSVRPLRTGRPWVIAPDAASLRARWDRLVRAPADERERLFRATRSRTPRTPVAALPADPARWSAGVELGQELLRLQLRGARGAERPRLPGGRRPYVRAAVPPVPAGLAYDADSETLTVGTGRISPVPPGAW
ncbi:type ISP restriction/modification enzyme, partial [Streptomyces sanglieri]|uniref:type ISP restriction/modification enzyme n=1 Tax=Streptomyces sanglieri TaxID=193460 RepID=UPI0035233784